jgi:inorganic triphosphatase YgiF
VEQVSPTFVGLIVAADGIFFLLAVRVYEEQTYKQAEHQRVAAGGTARNRTGCLPGILACAAAATTAVLLIWLVSHLSTVSDASALITAISALMSSVAACVSAVAAWRTARNASRKDDSSEKSRASRELARGQRKRFKK